MGGLSNEAIPTLTPLPATTRFPYPLWSWPCRNSYTVSWSKACAAALLCQHWLLLNSKLKYYLQVSDNVHWINVCDQSVANGWRHLVITTTLQQSQFVDKNNVCHVGPMANMCIRYAVTRKQPATSYPACLWGWLAPIRRKSKGSSLKLLQRNSIQSRPSRRLF